jgi:FG-GAP-like repeat/IPT/TIG domain/Immunoglobulin I-set domain/FG-GAP repeat
MKTIVSFIRILPIGAALALSGYTQSFHTNASPLLDINFGAPDTNKVGFAAIGQTTNDYWNGYQFGLQTYGAVTNLKWVDRNSSGIDLTVLNAPGNWANNTGDGMYDPFIYPWDGGNITVTLSNVPSGIYDFYLYGHSSNAWENTKFQMTSGTNTTAWKQTQDSTIAATSTNWAEGVQYVVFRNMVIASGQPAVITCAPGDQWNAILNGLQMISDIQTPPVITSFSPASAFTGSIVVISGLNFSPIASNNIVYFGAVRATVTAASTTSLTVMVPVGATYTPITETVNGLTAYSDAAFLPTFHSGGTLGSASFGPQLVLGGGYGPSRVVFGDMDGDGKPDVVVANIYDGSIWIYRNINTNGTLTAASLAPPVIFDMGGGRDSTWGLALADLDGDGRLDIVLANRNFNTVSVFQNFSTPGNITTNSFGTRVDLPVAGVPFTVAVADLDGDGKPDIIVSDQASNMVSVLKNVGTSGTIWTNSFAAPVNFAVGPGPSFMTIADLDGDGKPDVVTVNGSDNNNAVSVLRNTSTVGNITFAPAVNFPGLPSSHEIAIGDLDGDGKPDLAVSSFNNGQAVSIYRNTSTPGGITFNSFSPHVDYSVGGWGNTVAIGDLDGDGKPDVLVTTQLPDHLSLFRNISSVGTISLGSRVDLAAGYNPNGVAVGDLDGDGRPDIMFGNSYDNTISIYQNIIPTSTLPTITSQPQDTYVHAYDTASFSVTATGASSYHWLFNGSNVLSATSSNLVIPDVVQSVLGAYSAIVANSYGAVTSSIANLYMYPFLATPFTGLVTDWGQNTTLSIVAWGSGPLTFQWYDNGAAISNATNSTLTFSAIQFTNAGSYSVVISSSLGSVTNTAAQVVVNPAGVSLGLYPGLTVTGTVGYTYNIQSNPDLTNPNGWTTVATLTLWQPVQFWVDVNNNAASPTNQHRYYRVLPAQ